MVYIFAARFWLVHVVNAAMSLAVQSGSQQQPKSHAPICKLQKHEFVDAVAVTMTVGAVVDVFVVADVVVDFAVVVALFVDVVVVVFDAVVDVVVDVD